MASEHLALYGDGDPDRPGSGALNLPAAWRPESPGYPPDQLPPPGDFVPREELWNRLSVADQRKVIDRTGSFVEWWATDHAGGVSVVVLGKRSLVHVEPTATGAATGEVEYRITGRPLDPHSFHREPVTGPTGEQVDDGPVHGPRPLRPRRRTGRHRDPAPGTLASGRLDPAFARMFGQLPERAQRLLREPFVATRDELECHWWYHLDPTSGARGGSLHFCCYLADRSTVTAAAGVGHGFRGLGADSWNLVCWRANILPDRTD